MNTLDLEQAAAWLKIHPNRLQERVKRGEIPGAKIGKRWVFIEEDLAEYVRSKYRGEDTCSTGEETSGGSRYTTADEELDALLDSETKPQPNAGMTNLKLVSGKKK